MLGRKCLYRLDTSWWDMTKATQEAVDDIHDLRSLVDIQISGSMDDERGLLAH